MARARDPQPAVPVAIVGAGPVGLALALGLARRGVRSVVLEKELATSEYSRAPAILQRTREVLRSWGVERRLVEAGTLVRRLDLLDVRRGRPLLSLDISALGEEADDPALLILEQGETERLLLEAVRETGLSDVRFSAEAVALAQHGDGVALTVRGPGSEYTVRAAFAVGCDGASSFVRKALDLSFDGTTYSIRPMLADVRIEDERDGLPWPRVWNGTGGFAFTVRLSPGLWRIVRLEPRPPDGDRVPDEEVARRVDELLAPGPAEIVWASRFRIHRRSAPTFRVGRVLLAGDAAHLHSPVGGMGMNGGIQDAHNLAWKLAAALRGGDVDRLLGSYDAERRAVVVGSVTRYTDLLTRAFLQTPARVRAVAFLLARTALRVRPLRKRALRRMMMLDLDYPASPLLDPGQRAAGVRLPNPMLRSPDGRDVRLHDLLAYAPALLEVAPAAGPATGAGYGGAPARARDAGARGRTAEEDPAAELPVDRVIRIGPGGYQDPARTIRGLLGPAGGWILVRPDAHVAWARPGRHGLPHATRLALGR